MKLQLGPSTKPLQDAEVTRTDRELQVAFADHVLAADVVEMSPGVYSVLLGGRSFEVRVEQTANTTKAFVGDREFLLTVADPRTWRRRRGGTLEADGRQEVAAPMPGKVVRVLVTQGERVEAGQGLLVIEAMKMQNEVRSPKRGKVERVLIREGQAVNAGEILAVIN